MANTFHYPCIYYHHTSHSFTHVPHLFLHYSHRWIYCILCVTIKFHRKHHQMQNLLLGDLWVDYCHYIGNSRRVIKRIAPISDPLLTICYPVGDFHRGDPYWICQLHLPPRGMVSVSGVYKWNVVYSNVIHSFLGAILGFYHTALNSRTEWGMIHANCKQWEFCFYITSVLLRVNGFQFITNYYK